MLFFGITLIILLALSFTGIPNRWFFIILVAMSFFLGFRGATIGDDTTRYINYYYSVDMHYDIGYMEIGWNYLSELFRSFKISAYAFHFFIAFCTLMCWGYTVNKVANKSNKIRGYALFFLYSLGFYLYMFNGMRQLLAVSIVFLAFYLLSTKKNWLFVLLVIFAALFHYSALFALLIYPIQKMTISPKAAIWTLFSTFIMGFMVSESWFYLFAGKYSSELEHFGFRTSIMYAVTVGLLTNLFFCWLIANNKKSLTDIWMKYFFFSIIVMNILSSVVYGPRIVYYFSITQTLALAIYVSRTKHIFTITIIYLYSIITFGRYLLPELYKSEGSLLPYYQTIQLFD